MPQEFFTVVKARDYTKNISDGVFSHSSSVKSKPIVTSKRPLSAFVKKGSKLERCLKLKEELKMEKQIKQSLKADLN